MKKTLYMLISLIFIQQLAAQNTDRIYLEPCLAPFYHGVASGDPMSDRVILWTRVTTTEPTAVVTWEIASDSNFISIANSGTFTTDASRDYTVKVDATGLLPNSWYYYRFQYNGMHSIIGRTHTAPSGTCNNMRFAVLACSNYQSGYFNAYHDIAQKNDIDAVLHLGDYIYEYGIDDFDPTTDTSRLHIPETEITTLSDYRMRYSHYHLDHDLMRLHQLFPFICIWDDHEVANNSWKDGAANHTEGTEGLYVDRKANARKAYFEWIPIRDIYNSNDTIHRSYAFGDLIDLILLDTRLEGREEQIGTTSSSALDTNRTLLGAHQLQWFKDQLSASTARWKLIGNQVMIAPLKISGVAVNDDQWDGYPAERAKVLNHIKNNNIKNTVFLTGDIHTSWANDVAADYSTYDEATGSGSDAVEYVCTSVTSTSFLTFGVPISMIQFFNPHIKYADLSKRGYILLDVDTQRVQADWVHMSTVSSPTYTSSVSSSWEVQNHTQHLTASSTALSVRGTNPPAQSFCNTTAVSEVPPVFQLVQCYPNPAQDYMALQYFLYNDEDLNITIYDMQGKPVFDKKLIHAGTGLKHLMINIKEITSGSYLLNLANTHQSISLKFIKQ